MPQHAIFVGPKGLAGCLSSLLTLGVYAAEASFLKLPVHWKRWPAIGGVAVGLDGMIFPRALDVGYCTIRALLQGDVPRTVIGGYCQLGPVPGAGRVLD